MAAPETASSISSTTTNFDPLARIYRWMEYLSFGPMLERCRGRFLAECANARRALVLGDGDGRFTARLLTANRIVQIDAVDSSSAMLTALRRRAQQTACNAPARLQTLQADLRGFIPARSGYDLVISHFFLDCLTDDEVADLIERILPHLTPDATWLVSEFAIPEKSWRRDGARLLVRFLYFAFHKMTRLQVQQIPDYARAFSRCGFRRRQQVQFLGGLLTADQWKRTAP